MVGGRVADGAHDLSRGAGEDGGPPRVEVVHPQLARRLRGVADLYKSMGTLQLITSFLL